MSTTNNTTTKATTKAHANRPANHSAKGGALAASVKPFYAYVGAGDLAAEKVRALPAVYTSAAKARQETLQTQVKELRGALTAQVKELPATVKDLRGTVTAQVKDLPSLVKALPAQATKVPALASSQAKVLQVQLTALPTKVTDTVTTTIAALGDQTAARYTELATRGAKLVGSIRQQGSTGQAKRAAKNTVAAAKGVRTSATKTAKATVQAVEDAAAKIG